MPWSTPFPVPITLPNGQRLASLGDALTYIQSLPREVQEDDRWQLAETALRRAERDAEMWLDFARAGMMQALTVSYPVTGTMPRRPPSRRR